MKWLSYGLACGRKGKHWSRSVGMLSYRVSLSQQVGKTACYFPQWEPVVWSLRDGSGRLHG